MKKRWLYLTLLCAVFVVLNVLPAHANEDAAIAKHIAALDEKINELGLDRAILGDQTTADVVRFYVTKQVPQDKIAALIEKDPKHMIQFIAEATANGFTDEEIHQYIDGSLATTTTAVGPNTPSNVIDNGDGTVTLPNGDVVAIPHYTDPSGPPPSVDLKDNGDGTVTLPNGDIVALPPYSGPEGARPPANAADANISIDLNGDLLNHGYDLGKPFIHKDRAMIPLRMVSMYLGYDVSWTEGKVTISKENENISFQVGEKTYLINGQSKSFVSETMLRTDRVYLPVRDIAELYGSVQWDAQRRRVSIFPEKDVHPFYRIEEVKEGTVSVVRHDAGKKEALTLPADDALGLSPGDFLVSHKRMNRASYLLILKRNNHANQADLYRVDGNALTALTRINAGSSYVVDEENIYTTDGVSAGPWTSGIRSDVLRVRPLDKNKAARDIVVDFNINTCLLSKDGNALWAIDPAGKRHRVPLT